MMMSHNTKRNSRGTNCSDMKSTWCSRLWDSIKTIYKYRSMELRVCFGENYSCIKQMFTALTIHRKRVHLKCLNSVHTTNGSAWWIPGLGQMSVHNIPFFTNNTTKFFWVTAKSVIISSGVWPCNSWFMSPMLYHWSIWACDSQGRICKVTLKTTSNRPLSPSKN